mgnify:CR=1 FL=1
MGASAKLELTPSVQVGRRSEREHRDSYYYLDRCSVCHRRLQRDHDRRGERDAHRWVRRRRCERHRGRGEFFPS